MKSLWIIGAGKFGIKAATVLKKKYPDVQITFVDSNNEALCGVQQDINDETVCQDGIVYLSEHLDNSGFPEWIIPVIPVHIAYEWIKKKLSDTHVIHQKKVPEALHRTLPNAIMGKGGEAYISYADFICPDGCSEPDNICTFTGHPRLGILHKTLELIDYKNYESVVVQSIQLAPGIGGYRPDDLFRALEKVSNAKSPVLLSTACKCHGVMHAFEIVQACH